MWSSTSKTQQLEVNQIINLLIIQQNKLLGEILDVTTKPVIFDGDNGGRIEHISYMVRTLNNTGVSAVVFEDKVGKELVYLDKRS